MALINSELPGLFPPQGFLIHSALTKLPHYQTGSSWVGLGIPPDAVARETLKTAQSDGRDALIVLRSEGFRWVPRGQASEDRARLYSSFHLIEQPIDAFWSAGATPVVTIPRIASTSSRGAPARGGVVRPSSSRPRYLSLRSAL